MKRKPGDEWTTYRLTDGELINDQFGWVVDLEYFTDDPDRFGPVELVAETWVLKSVETITVDCGE